MQHRGGAGLDSMRDDDLFSGKTFQIEPGLILHGKGQVWLKDLIFEVVGEEN